MTSAFRLGRALLLACGVLLPASAGAQAVHGRVVDQTQSHAVSGAVVLLVDSAGAAAARALTNENGDFRLVAPAPGTYRIRTLRIGFRPSLSEALRLDPDSEVVRVVAMAGVPVSLAAVQVQGRRTCRLSADSALGTYAIWEQARTALTAAALAAGNEFMAVRLVLFERAFDAANRLKRESATLRSGSSNKPWISRSPETLRRVGYVTETNGTIEYVAPDLDVLLSPQFLEDHCFRVVRGRDTTLVGLAFDPTRERSRIPEIRGTVWLDRVSSELRRMEYRYTNVQRLPTARDAGGDIDFIRMKHGVWAIAQWTIRMPVLARDALAPVGPNAAASLTPPLRLVETRVTGGSLAFAARGADTLWSRVPQVVSGIARDSLTGEPVAGAQISIASLAGSVSTDSLGRFVLGGLVPGEYTVLLRRSPGDSLTPPWSRALAFTGIEDTLRLNVPSRSAVPRRPAGASFTGRVLSEPDGRPVPAAEVRITDLELSTRADSSGRFRLTEIPAGMHVVAARQMGYTSAATRLHFADTATVLHDFHLSRVQQLDTVAVAERSDPIPEFNERRSLGIGHFLGRAELERQEHRRLADVLSTVPGLKVFRAPGGQAWVINGRHRSGRTTIDSFSAGLGARPACYVDVWLDGMPMYIGSRASAGLFDVNGIGPATLEGVEFYASPAQTPIKYARYDNHCGVLVLWSRVGP